MAALMWLVPSEPGRALMADSWNRVTTGHFVVVGDVSSSRLADVANALEQFRQASMLVFPDRQLESGRPLTIVVIGDHLPDYGLGLKTGVGGYYMLASRRDFIVMESNAFGASSFRLVLHEYQHAINHANIRTLPRWADEGLAEFYSTFTLSSGGECEIGLPIMSHLKALRDDGLAPLEAFLRDDGRSIQMSDRRRSNAFYAQAWALIHFFMFGDAGKWRHTFGPFVQALSTGDPPMDALHRVVTRDDRTFADHFQAYIRAEELNFVRIKLQGSDDVAKPTRGTATVAETAYLRSRFLVDHEKALQAADEGLRADPNDAQLLTQRAASLLNSGSVDAAADVLLPLAKAGEGDDRTCALAKRVLNVQARFEESIAACTAADTDAPGTLAEVVALEALQRSAEAARLVARLDRDDTSWPSLRDEAWKYLISGGLQGAATAAGLAASREPDAEEGAYLRFVKWAATCLQSKCDQARAELGRQPLGDASSAWVQNIYRFLMNELPADKLIKVAPDKAKETEAHTYIGLDLAGRGQRAEALQQLQWVVDHGSTSVYEYQVATAVYARLRDVR